MEPLTPGTRVVLVGMDLRADTDHPTLTDLATRLHPVGAVAYLQLADPTLSAVLDASHAAGDPAVTLVPTNLRGVGVTTSWVRRVAAHWASTVTAPPVLALSARTLTDPADLTALLAEPTRPVTDGAPLRSPAWETVPAYRHHVLVCRGPRCSARGADRIAATLADHTEEPRVLVTNTGCLFPCNHAPVVTVHPDDTWYGDLTPDTAALLAAEHLIADRPLPGHRVPRDRPAPGGPP